MKAGIRFVSAGAGSGKTHRLMLILHEELVCGRVRPRGVLATTFTRKAAAELRNRVRSHLIESGSLELANAMEQARIGTVNSVCGELLVRFAFEAGLPPELRVLEEEGAKDVLSRAMDAVVEGPKLGELIRIAHRMGLADFDYVTKEYPWRTALRSLVDHARANGLSPEALRGCGETNADELLAHFGQASKVDLDKKLGEALRAAHPALKKQAKEGGVKKSADYLELVEKVSKELPTERLEWSAWNKLANADPEKGLVGVAQPIKDAASSYLAHPRLHDDVRKYLRLVFDLAADTLDTFDRLKRQLGVIDFVDQERRMLDVLGIESVRQTLAEELDLLMVDEFQDTSPIQLALFTRLAELARQVVWVGDVKQAIYGFRGSDARLMGAVLSALASKPEILDGSWRSRPSLVSFINATFGDAFPGLGRDQVELKAMRKEFEGTPAVIDWTLLGKNKEAHWHAVASGIAQLVNEKATVCEPRSEVTRPVRFGDIAVLARTNEAVLDVARILTARGIPCSTSQPGLARKPEIVLAMACVRRLNDESDTVATAEILSLADCAAPEEWLGDRLAWRRLGLPDGEWKERAVEGSAAHPILWELASLRSRAALMSPTEAVESVIAGCGLTRRTLQWQQTPDVARLRLANLDRLVQLAAEYEDERRAASASATLSGFIRRLDELEERGLDELPEPGIDAVRVMTHHRAKGLEWPVVVACDLAANIRDRLWGISAESPQGVDVADPLRNRFLRYWPWPFGRQRRVPVAERIAESAAGKAVRQAAVEEERRLLYVSLTRARDVLVLARPEKAPDGEWMDTVGLGERLDSAKENALPLTKGTSILFRRSVLEADTADLPARPRTRDLHWFAPAEGVAEKLPLRVSPSKTSAVSCRVAESATIGSRMDTSGAIDRQMVGDVLHSCVAAEMASKGGGVSEAEVVEVIRRAGLGAKLAAADVRRQVRAVREWIGKRWPGATPYVEVPLMNVTATGQEVAGRVDLLLRSKDGWVLLDHKSTPEGSARWKAIADAYGGQLSGYKYAIEGATGEAVPEVWLVMPVAGAAIRVERDAL